MKPAIILVDDDTFILQILEHIMAALVPDYDVVAAVDGAAALALLAQRPVALVITDLRMPDMDGVALTVAIKAAMPQCPVILMTGYPTPECHQRAQAAGVEYFVPKPFRIDQLAGIVRAALAP
jgi:DNA-binding NtrC family response regulator